MSIEQEKRMAGDYVIIHAFHIGDREIVLGENPASKGNDRYMPSYIRLGLKIAKCFFERFCNFQP